MSKTNPGNNQELTKVNSTGLVEIIIPHIAETTYLCYPKDYQEYHQVYLFSHIACRQMGFMTFVAMKEKSRPEDLDGKINVGLRSNIFNCTGQEQTVSHCSWSKISTTNCQFITEISCGGCHNIVKGFNGVAKSPGFPFAYLYDITCEWDIMVPRRQTILLTISPFGKDEALATNPCELHKPNVEIMYGVQSAVTVLKLCNLKEALNLSIPFNTVKIRIFTGFYSKSRYIENEKEQGISIDYEAIGIEREYFVPLKLIFLTIFGVLFLSLLVVCRYIQKHKLCDVVELRKQNLPPENFHSVYDLGKRPEFQQCYTQKTLEEKPGLRLRSNGSDKRFTGVYFSSTPMPANCASSKQYRKHPSQVETPKIIPEIVLHDCDKNKKGIFDKVKANLLNRYSNKEDRNSNKLSVSSIVFSPEVSSLERYNSAFESGDEIDTRTVFQEKQP